MNRKCQAFKPFFCFTLDFDFFLDMLKYFRSKFPVKYFQNIARNQAVAQKFFCGIIFLENLTELSRKNL